MIFKKIALGLLSLCLLGTSLPSEAGIASKGVKGYVAAKVVQKTAPVIAKKIIQNKAKKLTKEKLAKNPLTKEEFKVGKYGDLIDSKKTTKKLIDSTKTINDASTRTQSHHIPSDAFMKKRGISKENGIAVEMQEARHGLTRTYKGGNSKILKNNETPRESLARDIKDFKNKYRYDPEIYKKSRTVAQEIIKQNKENHPNLFKKSNN